MALPDILTWAVPLGSTRSSENPDGTSTCVSDPRTLCPKAASSLTLTRLYVFHRPEPLTKGFPQVPWSKTRPTEALGRIYRAPARPCCGMEQSQGEHAGWHCPSTPALCPCKDPRASWEAHARSALGTCLHHVPMPRPFPSTTASVNPTSSLHLSPHLTSQKLLTSLCIRALKHSSLASPTPHLPGCLVSRGPDPLWGLLFHHPARKWGRSHVSSPPVSPQETSCHSLALEPCPQGGLQLGYCLVSKSCPTLGVEPPWSEIPT